MAQGYLVTLGDTTLDAGDVISGALITYTTDFVIGSGSWTWSGTWTVNDTNYNNITDSGTYELGTDGNVYFIPTNWFVDPITTASATTAPTYTIGDTPSPFVEGTTGSDTVDNSYTDSDGDQVSVDHDFISTGDGNDTITSTGGGNDTAYGGIGSDTITTGSGDDTVYGDSNLGQVGSVNMSWLAEGASGTDVTAGFTQDTGDINVEVTITDLGGLNNASTNNSTQYGSQFDNFNPNSALQLGGNGSATSGVESGTAEVKFDFSDSSGGLYEDEVANVQFRINDIDQSSWDDQVTVVAFDSAGNPVYLDFQLAGDDILTGNSIDGVGNDSQADEGGSVLINVPGPVASIEITYANTGTGGQALWITDVAFDPISITETFDDNINTGSGDDVIYGELGDDDINAGSGDDIIDGGVGDDTIYAGSDNDTVTGGAGNDTIFGQGGDDIINGGEGDDTVTFSEGDNIEGGSGNDTFVLEDLGEPSNGVITIDGGSGDEGLGGDTLQLGNLGVFTQDVIDSFVDDGTASFSGSVTLDDGTILNFSEIENIICFTKGAMIATPRGARAIEDLRIGDLVVTRDHGLQPIRWMGNRTVPAMDKFAPVQISQSVLPGSERDILVSPQHRMLFQGYRAELLIGESEVLVAAKHLINGKDVFQKTGGLVTYYHMMFEHHEIVFADGASSESFHPGEIGLSAVTDAARNELFSLFPELRSDPNGYGQTARRCLRKCDAVLLRS